MSGPRGTIQRSDRIARIGTILVYVLVAEGILISALWLTNSISRFGFFVGMGIFLATFIALIIAGQLLKRASKAEGSWRAD
jgi:hypothetical protein